MVVRVLTWLELPRLFDRNCGNNIPSPETSASIHPSHSRPSRYASLVTKTLLGFLLHACLVIVLCLSVSLFSRSLMTCPHSKAHHLNQAELRTIHCTAKAMLINASIQRVSESTGPVRLPLSDPDLHMECTASSCVR